MGIKSLSFKAALLIPYLVLVVMFPCTRGERLQKYHFFQFLETYHPVELSAFPVVGETSKLNHKHLPLFFYPSVKTSRTGNFFPAVPSAITPKTGLLPAVADSETNVAAGSWHSPPLYYLKTVSGLSPPQSSDV